MRHLGNILQKLTSIVLVIGMFSLQLVAQGVNDDLWTTNGEVRAIVISGRVAYVGGSFSQVGIATGSGIGWTVPFSHQGTFRRIHNLPYADSSINAVIPDGMGGWFIGGSFKTVGTQGRSGLAHILADGTVGVWNPSVATANAGNGAIVYSLCHVGDTIVVGGQFDRVGGEWRHNLAAIDKNGKATSWDPLVAGVVYATAENDGIVYIGGSFGAVRAQHRQNFAAIDQAGRATLLQPDPDGPVRSLTVFANSLVVGGQFTHFAGRAQPHLAAIALGGNGTATAPIPASGVAGAVYAMAVSGSRLYVVGTTSVIGWQGRSGIATLGSLAIVDAARGVVQPWGPIADAPIFAIAACGGDVFIGGSFHEIRGVPSDNIGDAAASAGSTARGPSRLNATVRSLACWTTPPYPQIPYTLFYAGGDFNLIDQKERQNLAALDLNTGTPTDWDPGASGPVNAMGQEGNTLYVGGEFSSVGGLARSYLAAVVDGKPTGWSPAPDAAVHAIAVSGGTIYVGGKFKQISGIARRQIAAIDANGSLTSWDPRGDKGNIGIVCVQDELGISEITRAMAVSNSTVYAAGTYGVWRAKCPFGETETGIVAIDRSDASQSRWQVVDGPIYSVAIGVDKLYIAGGFTTVGQASNTPETPMRRSNAAAFDACSDVRQCTLHLTGWDPQAYTPVTALAVSKSNIYLGGNGVFGWPPRYGISIAAVDAVDGSRMNRRWDADGGVVAIRLDSCADTANQPGRLYAGGNFFVIGGKGQPNFAAAAPADCAP